MERGKGQGLVEYGLLILLIVVVAVAALALFGDSIQALFEQAEKGVTDAPGNLNPAD